MVRYHMRCCGPQRPWEHRQAGAIRNRKRAIVGCTSAAGASCPPPSLLFPSTLASFVCNAARLSSTAAMGSSAMPSPAHSSLHKLLQLTLFLLLSASILPISTTLAIVYSIKHTFAKFWTPPRQHFAPRKFLLTGAGTPAGLAVARALSAAGHLVIAADVETWSFSSNARISTAVSRFYRLLEPGVRTFKPGSVGKLVRNLLARLQGLSYTAERQIVGLQQIVKIAEHEKPDLWIPCDSSYSFATIYPKTTQASKLLSRRLLGSKDELTDGHTFELTASSLDTDVRAPIVRQVTTRGEIHKILSAASGTGQHFILERTAHDPRGGIVLPRPTQNDTYQTIAGVQMASSKSWTLRELVHGNLYVAHGLVVNGALKAVVAGGYPDGASYDNTNRPEIPHLDGIRTLLPDGALHAAIVSFSDAFASSLGLDVSAHLSIWFCVSEVPSLSGSKTSIHAVDYELSPHPSLSLLAQQESLVAAYIKASVTPPSDYIKNGGVKMVNGYKHEDVLTATSGAKGVYSLPSVVMEALAAPLTRFFLREGSFTNVVGGLAYVLERTAFWQEELLDKRDPWPGWVNFHIVYPLRAIGEFGDTHWR